VEAPARGCPRRPHRPGCTASPLTVITPLARAVSVSAATAVSVRAETIARVRVCVVRTIVNPKPSRNLGADPMGGFYPPEGSCHVGSITASSGLESSFLEADGTRSTQDVRRPWTKRSGDSQNRMAIRCAQWNASRAASWRRRRVAVARPVRIGSCTNLRFSSRFKKCPKSAKKPN